MTKKVVIHYLREVQHKGIVQVFTFAPILCWVIVLFKGGGKKLSLWLRFFCFKKFTSASKLKGTKLYCIFKPFDANSNRSLEHRTLSIPRTTQYHWVPVYLRKLFWKTKIVSLLFWTAHLKPVFRYSVVSDNSRYA